MGKLDNFLSCVVDVPFSYERYMCGFTDSYQDETKSKLDHKHPLLTALCWNYTSMLHFIRFLRQHVPNFYVTQYQKETLYRSIQHYFNHYSDYITQEAFTELLGPFLPNYRLTSVQKGSFLMKCVYEWMFYSDITFSRHTMKFSNEDRA